MAMEFLFSLEKKTMRNITLGAIGLAAGEVGFGLITKTFGINLQQLVAGPVTMGWILAAIYGIIFVWIWDRQRGL